MKNNDKRYIVQPQLKNDVRSAVEDWCTKTFGNKFKGKGDNQYLEWCTTGNYARGMEADFDFITVNKKHAICFALKYKSDILEEETID